MKSKWFLICLLLLLVLSVPVIAEKKEKQQEAGTKTFDIKSEHWRAKKKEKKYTWTGNVKFKYDDIEIEADKLKINKNEKLAHFTGEVHLIRKQNSEGEQNKDQAANQANKSKQQQNNKNKSDNQQAQQKTTTDKTEEIWSKKLDYDYQKEVLVAKEDVKLETTKENKPLDLTSQYLKLWTKSNDMVAKEDVFVDYDGQKIRGQHLEYTADKDKMVVTEDVEVKEEDNWMQSKKAVFWLADDVLEAEGKVEMEFEVED